ncbi:hypothetical protein CVT25_006921 [Psilocybe cyanescens]|uniref:Peptidase A1 domain-containing protein n=1 Tax=Psilocybe cyanescens TaxID=93625 RepID=A0A409X5V5_PSICY|nr:hypothetical protein CVT25_006921 [Psilocybe cyanescens]
MRITACTFVTFLLVLSSYLVDALKIPFSRQAPKGISLSSPFGISRYSFASSSGKETVNDVQDVRYVTNITINGVQVQVALDTGSTDLWVIPPGGLGIFNDTGLSLDLLYGDGSYGTSGTIGIAPFQFGSYHIERQAFLNAIESSIGGLQELGVYGLMGLSFDFSTSSPINQKIKSVYGPDATWGQSVLANIFQQNPAQPNFIAIDLARSADLEDIDGGSFTIGEYEPHYAAVANMTKLSQHPKGGDRWTTLLEGMYVDNQAIDVVSTIAGVPAGQSQALLDTGDPNAILPVAMYNALYSRIPGSALHEGATGSIWIIPCNTTTHVEVAFGGERYPIHPLDLSTISDPLTINGEEWVACVAAFKGADRWGGDAYDISLGDSFLRNVYSVFDFGDALSDGPTSDPYMQLLSQVDPAQAITEVATIRARTMANLPPEMDPTALVALLKTYGSTTDSTQTDGIVSPTGTSSADIPGASTTDTGLSATNEGSTKHDTDLAVDTNHSITLDESTFRKYGLIVICLLGANLFIGLVLTMLGVLACMRRGASRKNLTRTASTPAYVPVKSDETYSDKPYYTP